MAHFYNASILRKGRLEAVVNAKHMKPEHTTALVEDIERGVATGIRPQPWQTDTCIGSWHYSREIAAQNKYKTVGQVVDMLIDIVSKNGNLMLSVPVRGDGTIDEHEVAFLEGMATWMKVNDEGIFGSRPWKVYGEGPSTVETPERVSSAARAMSAASRIRFKISASQPRARHFTPTSLRRSHQSRLSSRAWRRPHRTLTGGELKT